MSKASKSQTSVKTTATKKPRKTAAKAPRFSGVEVRTVGHPKILKKIVEPKEAAIKTLSQKNHKSTLEIHKLKAQVQSLQARLDEKPDPFDELELVTESLRKENENLKSALASEQRSAVKKLLVAQTPESIQNFCQNAVSASALGLSKLTAGHAAGTTELFNMSDKAIRLDDQNLSFDFAMKQISFIPQAEPKVYSVPFGPVALKAATDLRVAFLVKSNAKYPISYWVRHMDNTDQGLTLSFDISQALDNSGAILVDRKDTPLKLVESWIYPVDEHYSLCALQIHSPEKMKARLSFQIRAAMRQSHLMQLDNPVVCELGLPKSS